jgi:hypothetical protein
MWVEQLQTALANEFMSENAILHSPRTLALEEVIGIKQVNKDFS